jgi:hypothetical protein
MEVLGEAVDPDGLQWEALPETWEGLTGSDRDWLATCMNEHWDRLDDFCRAVAAEFRNVSQSRVREAWAAMVFRGFCWHHCHRMEPMEISLPSAWHGSRVPIYLG